MINSTARADKCGVCNGDNNGANTITKSFTGFNYGMNVARSSLYVYCITLVYSCYTYAGMQDMKL